MIRILNILSLDKNCFIGSDGVLWALYLSQNCLTSKYSDDKNFKYSLFGQKLFHRPDGVLWALYLSQNCLTSKYSDDKALPKHLIA